MSKPLPSSCRASTCSGNAIGVNFTTVKDMFAWVGPVLAARTGNAICDANPSCTDTRIQFQKLVAARDDGRLDQINTLAEQLQGFGDRETLNATVKQRNGGARASARRCAPWSDRPGGLEGGPRSRAGRQPARDGASRWPAVVDQLVGQVKLMGTGLDEAAAFLFWRCEVMPQIHRWRGSIGRLSFQLDEFKAAAKIFISPDGRSARYWYDQPVQRRSDGSGQLRCTASGNPTEHPTGGRHDIDGRISRRAAGYATITGTTSVSSSS